MKNEAEMKNSWDMTGSTTLDGVDTSFSSVCTVRYLFFLNNREEEEIMMVGLQGEKTTAALTEKEEATNIVQRRGERSVHSIQSGVPQLCVTYTCKLSL